MTIKLDNDDNKQLNIRKVTVLLNDDVEYQISINKFGELVVQKHNFADGEGSIVLKPSVSNEIRLL